MKHLYICILVFSCIKSYSQNGIRIQVVDEKGDAVESVSFNVNGKSFFVEFSNGVYVLDSISLGKEYCLTHVQYLKECVIIKSDRQKVVLKSSVNQLDEAVVVAYDNTSRRYNTGNIVQINSSDLQNRFSTNNLVALQGLASGLDISQHSGLVGSRSNVRVQGQGSISFSAPPLYVIDGVPQQSYISQNILSPSQNIWGGSGGEFYRGNITDYVDINNIESVTILKDADATSIYGSRGANGVVIITTKRKSGKENSLEFIQNVTWSKVFRRLDMMNTEEYLYMRRRAVENDGLNNLAGSAFYDLTRFDSTDYTDWQEVFLRATPVNINSNLSFKSSGKNYFNSLSVNYLNSDQFFSVKGRFNSLKLTNVSQWNFWNDKIVVDNTINYAIEESDQVSFDLTRHALLLAPNFPSEVLDASFDLRDNSGNLIFDSYFNNAIAIARSTDNIYKGQTFVNNFRLKVNILNNLMYDVNLGYTKFKSDDRNYVDLSEARIVYNNPSINSSSTINFTDRISRSVESYFTYKNSFWDKSIAASVIVGYSYNDAEFQQEQSSYLGFLLPQQLYNFAAGSTVAARQLNRAEYKYKGYFIRGSTQMFDRFLFNANYRLDGSSRFAPENRWAGFYSLSAGWIVSSEKFFRNFLSENYFLKIRASYGVSGNDAIPDYSFLYRFTYSNNNLYNYGLLTAGNIYNPSYRWERLEKINVGLDFSMNNILDFTFNYSLNIASNQLLNITLPSHLSAGGGTLQLINMPATFHNESFEIDFKVKILRSSLLDFNINGNLTIPRSILKSFPGELSNSPVFAIYEVGKPTHGFMAADNRGVDYTTGQYMYKDSSDRSSIIPNQAFRERISVQPIMYSSLILGFDLKKLLLRTHFYYYNSRATSNSSYYYNTTVQGVPGAHRSSDFLSNQEARFLNNWDKDPRGGQYQKFSTSLPDALLDKNKFSFYYLRIQNISVSVPFRRFFIIQKGSFDINISNILIATNSNALNYETSSNLNLPSLTSFSTSLKVEL